MKKKQDDKEKSRKLLEYTINTLEQFMKLSYEEQIGSILILKKEMKKYE